MKRFQLLGLFLVWTTPLLLTGCRAGWVHGQENVDSDNDGYSAAVDCDDTNPLVHPGALEICEDGHDNDCSGIDDLCTGCPNGAVLWRCTCGGPVFNDGYCCAGYHQDSECEQLVDDDGDGYSPPNDCDDGDPLVNPGAPEVCGDGRDNDCADGDAECEACPEGVVRHMCLCGGELIDSGHCCEDSTSLSPCTGGGTAGIWISRAEVRALPDSGEAWESILDEADGNTGTPDLSDQNDDVNVRVMAKALVYARTGETRYLDDVLEALEVVTYDDTESGGRTLALGRELAAYVIAADLVDLQAVSTDLDEDFRDKLRELQTLDLDGRTLRSTHEDRPNNWGTHAGASRAAVAAYLGDTEEFERAAVVFMGYLGHRDSYAGFKYGSLSWQCDSSSPVGINPVGCVKGGHEIGGVLPDDQRRCGDFEWPPCRTNYAWEGLQGSLAQAVILGRQGYDVWNWGDQALYRAVSWLHDTTFEDGENFLAEGDDGWQPWLVNYFYCAEFPAASPARAGKNVGFTDWTHVHNPACGAP